MTDAGNWCLIESDPGVFTEMLSGFGVEGLQVEEVYSLDDDKSLTRPVYGLVFLFKWRRGEETIGTPSTKPDIFFAQQMIQNACATQALINLLMNIKDQDVKLGDVLTQYKEFSMDMDPATRGLCLSNCEPVRAVHNSFSRQTLFELDAKGGESEDNYHFVTYLPLGNKVYELDGLRDAPYEVVDFADGTDWLSAIGPMIQARMQKYSQGDIHFNLMAIVPNRKFKLEEMLTSMVSANVNNEFDEQIDDLKKSIADENYKMEMYHRENNRRRHNYTPFLIKLMTILAREGKLVGKIEHAHQTAKTRANLATDKTSLELKRKQ
uniref:Ubiquitin carboxyl-terminal hydrolase n=1 Tax=Caenorhabditis japonica TaxID=281687 RepID=A0A8R1E182_CAEJA